MKNVSILKNNIVHIQKSKFSGLIIDPSLGLRMFRFFLMPKSNQLFKLFLETYREIYAWHACFNKLDCGVDNNFFN